MLNKHVLNTCCLPGIVCPLLRSQEVNKILPDQRMNLPTAPVSPCINISLQVGPPLATHISNAVLGCSHKVCVLKKILQAVFMHSKMWHHVLKEVSWSWLTLP